jgi:hypothetical protein
MRPRLEVADIFRRHGDAFRAAQGDRLSDAQRRVMAAIAATALQNKALIYDILFKAAAETIRV